MKISVIGIGYVGLTTAVCFAKLGNSVMCMDTDEEKINSLKKGSISIYEPQMDDMLKEAIHNNNLKFTTKLKEAVEFAEVIFIAVGTPTVNNKPILKYVHAVIKEIAEVMTSYKLIVIKSTVPVGTCQSLKELVKKHLKPEDHELEFDIASNPEFLREGTAALDFMKPDRVVIGVENDRAKALLRKLYNFCLVSNIPVVITTLEAAEMIKYVSNAFLATKISYINEISILCDLYNVDVTVVAKGMGLDNRIGSNFLNPGPGYGGSCFPKDTKALVYIGKAAGYVPKIVSATIDVNESQAKLMYKKIINIVGSLRNKSITVLGTAFKPETDDIRESPGIKIADFLLGKKARVKVYDPKAMDNSKEVIKKAEFYDDLYSACEGSDCIIVTTDWEEFKEIDFERLKSIVNKPVLIDMRNMFNPLTIKNMGFVYEGVGRR